MEGRFILASLRWRRWVRWWGPEGRPPTPGCRSSRTCYPSAPNPDSLPCRWWRRSSRTDLKKKRGITALVSSYSFRKMFLKLDRSALYITSWPLMRTEPPSGLCQPSQLSAHYPLSNMAWLVCQTPTLPDLADILTRPAGSFPSIIPVWLSGQRVAWLCTGTSGKKNWHFTNRQHSRDTYSPKGLKYNRRVEHENH